MIKGFRLYSDDPRGRSVVKVLVNAVLDDYREVLIIRAQGMGMLYPVDITVIDPVTAPHYVLALVSDTKGNLILSIETRDHLIATGKKSELVRIHTGIADCISHQISDLSIKALCKL